MDKDNKILLIAILIMLVSIFSFSFNEVLTGKVTKESVSSVTVKPSEVMRGSIITVNVEPGPNGVDNRWAWVYREGETADRRVAGTAKRMCGTQSVCYDSITFTYLIEGNEDKFSDGKYFVKVKEHDTKEARYAKGAFWIEGYNKK